jgi:hypothetical protein|nr:MAG TPA: hypothetical protein [Caudoviricetes sp.]
MSKIIESKIKKLQELQAIENQFDEAIQDACANLMSTRDAMVRKLESADKSNAAIIKEYVKRIDNAIKELNGTRFERKSKAENDAVEPAKKGGRA